MVETVGIIAGALSIIGLGILLVGGLILDGDESSLYDNRYLGSGTWGGPVGDEKRTLAMSAAVVGLLMSLAGGLLSIIIAFVWG